MSKYTLFAFTLGSAFSLILLQFSANALTLESASRTLMPSLTRVVVEYVDCDLRSQDQEVDQVIATGFAINERYILTAGHTFLGSNCDHSIMQIRVYSAVDFTEEGAQFASARIIEVDRNQDVAVLRLNRQNRPSITPSIFCPSYRPEPGEKLYAFGYPIGQSLAPLELIYSGTDNSGRWQTSGLVISGMSGGPVVNDTGNVVGVIQGGLQIEKESQSSQVYAVRNVIPLRMAINDLFPSSANPIIECGNFSTINWPRSSTDQAPIGRHSFVVDIESGDVDSELASDSLARSLTFDDIGEDFSPLVLKAFSRETETASFAVVSDDFIDSRFHSDPSRARFLLEVEKIEVTQRLLGNEDYQESDDFLACILIADTLEIAQSYASLSRARESEVQFPPSWDIEKLIFLANFRNHSEEERRAFLTEFDIDLSVPLRRLSNRYAEAQSRASRPGRETSDRSRMIEPASWAQCADSHPSFDNFQSRYSAAEQRVINHLQRSWLPSVLTVDCEWSEGVPCGAIFPNISDQVSTPLAIRREDGFLVGVGYVLYIDNVRNELIGDSPTSSAYIRALLGDAEVQVSAIGFRCSATDNLSIRSFESWCFGGVRRLFNRYALHTRNSLIR